MESKIHIKQGDITTFEVDAIVNAANNDLLHGGGLAAAIIETGGNIIQKQSNSIAPIQVGEAAITKAGKLKAKYIIHAASMKLGEPTLEENLKNSINNSFKRAKELGVKSIAFPAVGAGIGGFSAKKCANICIIAALKALEDNKGLEKIIFVLKNESYKKIFDEEFKLLKENKNV